MTLVDVDVLVTFLLSLAFLSFRSTYCCGFENVGFI